MKYIFLSMLMMGSANAEDISTTETSYTGATMLEGDVDVTFETIDAFDASANPNAYAYFSGNTLYVGNSDEAGNSINAIIEFFWFQSSIDRGSDFYVAIVKARGIPAQDDKLWVTDWNDWSWSSPPALSVEAIADVEREHGAFRWDWAVPFENYGIDAYGQVTFTNSYGLGLDAEGAVMAHGEYPITEDGSVKAAGNVQTKGFLSSDYRVQTQYEVTLYEWDVYVNGQAGMMAWDTYLNLEARSEESVYHEYFMSIQVEEGETFIIDEMNISSAFDSSWWPWSGAHEIGVSLSGIEISAPFYEVEEAEEEEEEPLEEEWEPQVEEEEEEYSEGTYDDEDTEELSQLPQITQEVSAPVKGGCNAISNPYSFFLIPLMGIIARRRE